MSELEATIKDYREQLAAALDELDDTEVPAEPQGQGSLGPEEEAIRIAAASGPFSPEFRAWHEAHVAPTSRGLFYI